MTVGRENATALGKEGRAVGPSFSLIYAATFQLSGPSKSTSKMSPAIPWRRAKL